MRSVVQEKIFGVSYLSFALSNALNKAAEAVKKSLYKEMTSVSVRVFKKDELGQMKQLPLSATKA